MGQNQSVFKRLLLMYLRDLHNHKSLNSENYCDMYLVASCHKFSTISKMKYKGNIMFYYFQWSIHLNHQFDRYRGYCELVAEDKYRSLQSAMQANARMYFCSYCFACFRKSYLWCKTKIASAAEFAEVLFWLKPIVQLVQYVFFKKRKSNSQCFWEK